MICKSFYFFFIITRVVNNFCYNLFECIVLDKGVILKISIIHINNVDAPLKRHYIPSEPSIFIYLCWVFVNNLCKVFLNFVSEAWLTWWKLPNLCDPHDLNSLLLGTKKQLVFFFWGILFKKHTWMEKRYLSLEEFVFIFKCKHTFLAVSGASVCARNVVCCWGLDQHGKN